MKIGTTPTHKFTIPYDESLVDKVRITYSQGEKRLIKKENADITFDGNGIVVKLSQEETLSFNHQRNVEIQLKILLQSGEVVVSDIIQESAERCLDSEVL